MTTRNIVKQLQSQGYEVKVYVRKDGGVLIKAINGKKFTGAKGNIYARELLGIQFSKRRSEQLHKITRARSYYKTHKIETPEDLERFRKSVMRKWKKADLRGSISKYNLKKMIEDRGVEGAKQYLIEMERHTEGKAYFSAIEGLLDRISQDMNVVDGEDYSWLEMLYNLIDSKKEEFKQEWLFAIFDELYEFESNPNMSAHDLYIKVASLINEE